MGLAEYRRKRDFKATPEPSGGGARSAKRSFVVQLHHASRRHFDFRLEYDGVLKSWAVPKGPSFDPTVKRMAVEVEDHPIAYGGFEGDIPEGHYGAGHVDIFDEGVWVPENDPGEGLKKGELKFSLQGDVLRGSWVLVRTRRDGRQQQWLLIKHRDEYAGAKEANDFVDPETDRPWPKARRRRAWPKRAAPPEAEAHTAKPAGKATGTRASIQAAAFSPELCRAQEKAPTGPDWLHEVKWDGYRILATVVRGKVQLWSRNAIEWTHKLPHIAAALRRLGLRSAQLDGELVVVRDGNADFNALQARLSGETDDTLLYLLFDMPYRDGRTLRDLPLAGRKAQLQSLLDAAPQDVLRFSAHQQGNGAAVFAQATRAGLEGIVSKRADSAYTGTRSGAWVKVKGRPSDEFVVIGYTPPKGARQGIGALLLAQPRPQGLAYVGRVGTGLSNEQLIDLLKRLKKLHVKTPQADLSLLEKKDIAVAQWIKPALIVEVFFQGIGGQGLLRQPAWKALREDKTLADLKDNTQVAAASKSQAAPASRSAAPEARNNMKTPARTTAKATAKTKAKTKAKTPTADAPTGKVKLTSPERVVFPELGITKADVAAYYEAVAPLLLRELSGRPVSVVRCPDGSTGQCFFQKHVMRGWGEHIHGVEVQEKKGKQEYLCIQDTEGLLELVQMNVLELHPWGARSADLEHADRLIFDLDPHPTVGWDAVVAGARDVRAQLTSIGLCSFLRTSGGKGLHVVVPLDPPCPWDELRQFAQAVSAAMAELRPERYVAVAGEKNRVGKIFIDYLRNGHGATAVASYSLRARPAAGVAMPLSWRELGKVKGGDAFTIQNTLQRIQRRKVDPWEEIDRVKQTLPGARGGKKRR